MISFLKRSQAWKRAAAPGIRFFIRRDFKELARPEFENEWIFSMAKQFEKGTKLHDMTSSTHSCMLARRGEILFTCEDIGRHNAIDKAVGYGINSGITLSECILYTSGRVPVDMAEKSIAAGVGPCKAIRTHDNRQCPSGQHETVYMIILSGYLPYIYLAHLHRRKRGFMTLRRNAGTA